MALKFATAIDLVKNEIRNFLLHVLASDPSSPAEGQVHYNSTEKEPKFHNGSTFQLFRDAIKLAGQLPAYYLSRANHTGQQTASTISDFDAQVRTSGLHQMAAPTAPVPMNSQRLTGLADPTGSQDAATKNYVDNVASGLDVKASVRAATTANVTLSGTQTVDGVALSAGDRVLVKNQSTAAQNGIYTVAAGAWSRASDADANAEVTAGLFCFVEEGAVNGDTGWVLTTNAPITVGTTALSFTQFTGGTPLTASNQNVGGVGVFKQKNVNDLEFRGVNAGSNKVTVTLDAANNKIDIDVVPANFGLPKKYTALVGNGSATSFTITQATHGCAADRSNSVFVLEEATGAQVLCDVTVAAGGDVTLAFSAAPTASQYRVNIVG